MKKYNQFYTSSLFNIENKLETTFINVFTNEECRIYI